MTGEELQPFFNISLNSGALPRVLGEKLTEEEYQLLSERVQAAIEAAYEAGRESATPLLETVADYLYNPFEPDNQSQIYTRVRAALD